MRELLEGSFTFRVSEHIRARFASHGADHICLIFYRNGERVSSFCAEGAIGRTDYVSEKDGKACCLFLSLEEAIQKAENE